MCTQVVTGFQTIADSVENSFAVLSTRMKEAYTSSVAQQKEVLQAVHQVALAVFQAINDILKDIDATKESLQVVISAIDLGDMVGLPVSAFRKMKETLQHVVDFVFARSLFQQFHNFTTTSSSLRDGSGDIDHITKMIGNSAFMLSDGITFAKWCAEHSLFFTKKWYDRSFSVGGKSLVVSPEKIDSTACLVGFSSNITSICKKAIKEKGFTPESSLDLTSNVGKVVSVLSSRLPKQVASPLSALATLVSSSISLILFLGRRPGGCFEPHDPRLAELPLP